MLARSRAPQAFRAPQCPAAPACRPRGGPHTAARTSLAALPGVPVRRPFVIFRLLAAHGAQRKRRSMAGGSTGVGAICVRDSIGENEPERPKATFLRVCAAEHIGSPARRTK